MRPVLVVAAIYTILLSILHVTATHDNAGFADANRYHLPLVNWFVANGLTLNYPTYSTTAPGFHWLLAAVAWGTGAKVVHMSDPAVVLLPAVLCLAFLVITFQLLLSCGATRRRACLLLVPIASSKFFWWAALYPVTESLALVGYGMMGLALSQPGLNAPLFGVGAAIATFTRQLFWPVSLSAVPSVAALVLWGNLSWRSAASRVIVAVVPATAILIALVLAWGGLIPDGWARHKARALPNTAAIAHGIMLVGLLSVPFLRPDDLSANFRKGDFVVCLILGIGLWLGTSLAYDTSEGRWGSIVWWIARASPILLDRPLLLAPLLVLGLQTMFIGWRRAQGVGVQIPPELLIIGFYLSALGGQSMSWQRYIEVPALILLSCGLARTPSSRLDFVTLSVFAVYFIVGARGI